MFSNHDSLTPKRYLTQLLYVGLPAALLISWQLISFSSPDAFLNRLEFLIYDFRMSFSAQFFPPRSPNSDVVIVDIDEPSLRQEGRWPWSRTRVATLVDNLRKAGATVIAFDVVFSEPEKETLLKSIRGAAIQPQQKEEILTALQAWEPDEALGRAFKNIDVVLGFFFHHKESATTGKLRHSIFELSDQGVVITANGYTTSIPVIQAYAMNDGFVTTYFDSDGVIRRTPLIIGFNGQAYPSLALASVMSYLLVDTIQVDFDLVGDVSVVSRIRVTDQPLVTDAVGRVLIPYKKAESHFKTLSAVDVLEDKLRPSDVAGKIVFVGTSAIGLADLINTPFTTAFPGVEVNAIVAQTLLNGAFPYRPAWVPGAQFIFQVTLVLFLVALFCGRKPLVMLIVAVVTTSTLIGLNFWIWIKWQVDFPLFVSLVITLTLFIWYLILLSHVESQ